MVVPFKDISIFIFLQNEAKENVAAVGLNPRLRCLMSTSRMLCQSVTLFICRPLSHIMGLQGAFLEVQLEIDGPKRARGTGHLLNCLLTRMTTVQRLETLSIAVRTE